ncbi:MAG TPA: aspartate--tRNA ligase [Verrucomicrobiales bacterium]|nr:aspartate--tRNA ligase [Verrucomicrobiales bacterium]
MYRTHHCNELRITHVGEEVCLTGWVDSARDHGGVIFVDLRDREGITQVVFRPEENAAAAEASHHLREEDIIRVQGRVVQRLRTEEVDTENPNLDTGKIEVSCASLDVLSKAAVLPFQFDRDHTHEDTRLRHRYLDLRRPRMTRNLRLRHNAAKATRTYLDEQGFIEVETPILSKSTPEGARDFLVPARLTPGSFYALPQAPQQYKQLLMVAGVERYYQIARCFRDEDLRADRQLEFTQIDIEASFVTSSEIRDLVEGLLCRVFQETLGVELERPFLSLTHREAMDRFGIDKPDLRFGMELVDLRDVFADSEFKVFRGALDSGGSVKAINAKGFAGITTGQIERLSNIALEHGAKGLAFIKVENGAWKSPIVKFFTETQKSELSRRLEIEEGDLVLFGADRWRTACEVLGRVRLEVASLMNLLRDKGDWKVLWVTEFPLLDFDPAEQKWNAVHHPFTRPLAEDLDKLEARDFENVRSEAYDLVLNGFELGGGSIRIHEPELQRKLFSILGVTEEQQQSQFGHLLEAFRFGAPPHGGIALGFDRTVMLLAGEDSIREVIAFPKNNRGHDLMSQSPAEVDPRQLRDLYLRSTLQAKPAES